MPCPQPTLKNASEARGAATPHKLIGFREEILVKILWVVGGFVLLTMAKFWVVLQPDPSRRGYLPGDFGLGVEGSFYHALKRGVIPLWDPTLGTGALFFGAGTHHPMYVQAHWHLLYPFNLLILGLAERNQATPIMALHLQHALHYVLAGIFMYAYGRSLAMTPVAAFVAGMTFSFSGFMASHVLHWTMVDTATWLPLVLLLGRQAMEGHLRKAALGGLVLGIAFLAGYAGIFFLVLLALGIQGLWILGWRLAEGGWRQVVRPLALLALLVVIAAGTAAIQLLPMWEPATRSHQATLDYAWKAQGSLPPAALVGLLMPFVLEPLSWWRGNESEFYLYPGVLTLILAMVALWRVRTRPLAFHALLGGVGILLALGSHLPLHRLLFDLVPGFSYFRYPARSVLLLHFALAVIAGFGLDALRVTGVGVRDLAPLLRALRIAAAVGFAAVSIILIGVIATSESETSERLTHLLAQHLVFLILLGASLLILAGAPHGGWWRALAVATLVLDLIFWAFPIQTSGGNQDRILRSPSAALQFLAGQRGLFRIGHREALHAQQIYAHQWSVYNDESRFSPQSFIEIFWRVEQNPRLLDLLNVRYLIGMEPPTTRGKYSDLNVSPEVRRKVLPVTAQGPVATVRLISHLVYAAEIPQGTEVARIFLRDQEGRETSSPVRAGVESAEWAVERPGLGPAHRPARVAASWPVDGGTYQGHDFQSVLRFPVSMSPAEIEIRYVAATGVMKVRRLELAGQDLTKEEGRFRGAAETILENRYVLPRAFLIPRARTFPSEKALASALEVFDPEREILLVGPPPPDLIPEGWKAQGSVEVTEYGPHRVRIRAEVQDRAQYLLLSDHYERWWRAVDNGRPVPIFRADLDLRAVRLEPGHHDVVFTLESPLFHIGTLITLITLAVVGLCLASSRLPHLFT